MNPVSVSGFAAALRDLPEGTCTGWFEGRRYSVSKSVFNAGRSVKLVAEKLGGGDYVSLNFYALTTGARIHPCEMSRDKVIAFVTGFEPDRPQTRHPFSRKKDTSSF